MREALTFLLLLSWTPSTQANALVSIPGGRFKPMFGSPTLLKIKPFKVVVDAGNGMAGKVVPLLEAHLPIKVIPLNFELDGNFPAHPSNPLMPESQVQIRQAILKAKAAKGSLASHFRATSFSLSLGSKPLTGGKSSGEGRKSTTASKSGCTPLFLKALPHNTGTILRLKVARRMV